MPAREVIFRCDGGRRVGAGHVARSLRLALAFRAAGWEIRFVGDYDGIALALLESAGVALQAPSGDALGVQPGAAPVVVDSYELSGDRIEELARVRPVAFVADHDTCPRATAVLSYHLDSEHRLTVPGGTAALLGPAYAPADPRGVAARRERGFDRVLVSLGGGHHGERLIGRVVERVTGWGEPEVFVAGVEAVPGAGPRVAAGVVRGGLAERIGWADVAVSGSGSTPYDLACAGVPAVAVAVAENQLPIARAFAAAGIAAALDATAEPDETELEAALAELTDESRRRAMAAAGPSVVDGAGAFRARDALAAAFHGAPPPPVYSYPPDGSGGLELRGPEGPLGRVRLADGFAETVIEPGADAAQAAAALGGASELMLAAYPSLDALQARPGPEQRAFYEAAGFHVEADGSARRDRRPEGAIQT